MTRRHFTLLLTAGAMIVGIPSCGYSSSMTVYKDPDCSCCAAWVDHLRAHGFTVEVIEQPDLDALKTQYGIPETAASCHTAMVEGYVIEGHVPAADIDKLLRERPSALGLAVPGMPVGSPGMESSDGFREKFDVLLLKRDGSTSVFSQYG